MKRIIAACIDQVVEFSDKESYEAYIRDLECGRPQKYKVSSYEEQESGSIRIRIRKQYNNCELPDD